MLRLLSAEPPFRDTAVAGQAARLLATAESLGLWEPKEVVSRLDAALFDEALGAVATAGVATSAALEWRAVADKPAPEFAGWVGAVRDELRACPVPERELPVLADLFGAERLAELVGAAGSSLRRYLAGERQVPDDVAGRAHVVALIVGDLAGSYNDRGIRRWLERPRAQLDGRAPDEILSGGWDPDGRDVALVVALAGERAG